MRILHCCLSCFYIDGYNYQENVLPRLNKLDGHEVMILASTEVFVNNSTLGYVSPSIYQNEDGIQVVRLPYVSRLPHFVARKLRKYQGVLKTVADFRPDVILFHGTAAWELLSIAKYVKNNPGVRLFLDSHEDFNNSARGFISRNLLHRLLYRPVLRSVLPNVEKVLCISLESYDFMRTLYDIPIEYLEMFPLGGVIVDGEEYLARRSKARQSLGFSDSQLVVVHSGKMGPEKRTMELITALREIDEDNLRLVLIGSLAGSDSGNLARAISSDYRISFLGWKSADELVDYLCAADIYAQPGSQSATMQAALCCGCPVLLYPYRSHEPFVDHNGYYVKTVADITSVLREVVANPSSLRRMRDSSYNVAKALLDYSVISKRYWA